MKMHASTYVVNATVARDLHTNLYICLKIIV